MIRAGLSAIVLLSAGPACAQEDPTVLARAALQELAAAAEAAETAQARRDRVAALTQTVRAYESGLASLRAGMRQINRQEQALSTSFDARSEEISRLLGVLATLETTPTPLMVLHPQGPLASVRTGMMLAEVTPGLAAEAEVLRQELQQLTDLRLLQVEAEETLTTALLGAQSARTALSQAIAERTDLPRRFSADPDRLAERVAAAETLASFAQSLSDFGAPPEALNRPMNTGDLALPVNGTPVRLFNEADSAGIVRPGLLLATGSGALVSAPFAATIRYTGPLLDYGNVMILEPRAGTMVVLAGLGDVYGGEGEIVAPGDPLGLMGSPSAPADPEFAAPSRAQTGADRSETLYIEVREGEIPVDPATWFAIDRQE